MAKYLYNDYIKTLSERFEAALSTIKTGHNFDYGDEFEVALCQILRSVLPDNFGVCRGYVVDKEGNRAGDDIIIYEQIRFPTMGLRNKNDFSRKEFIPIEAVYCYIEAKHTINILGQDGQSLSKAITQTSNVKQLISTRSELDKSYLTPYIQFDNYISVNNPEGYPSIQNPAYTVIFANQVRDKKDGKYLTDANLISELVKSTTFEADGKFWADLIVLGKHNILIPAIKSEKHAVYNSPFWIPENSNSIYHRQKVDGIAFGLALTSIMSALDWIQLGKLSWVDITLNGLQIPSEEDL